MASPAPESSRGKKLNGLGRALQDIDLDGHDLPPTPASSSPRNGKKYALATELVYTESNDQYNAASVPIYQVCITLSKPLIWQRAILECLRCTESTGRRLTPTSPHSQLHLKAVQDKSTTTHAPAIPREHTSSATSPKS